MLGMLGVSAGIAGLGALAKQTIDLGGHIEDMARNLRMGKSEFQTLTYTAKLINTIRFVIMVLLDSEKFQRVLFCRKFRRGLVLNRL